MSISSEIVKQQEIALAIRYAKSFKSLIRDFTKQEQIEGINAALEKIAGNDKEFGKSLADSALIGFKAVFPEFAKEIRLQIRK